MERNEQSGATAAEIAEWQASIKPADPELSAWVAFRADSEKKGADLCRSAAKALVSTLALFFAGYIAFLRFNQPSAGDTIGRVLAPLPLVPWTVAGGMLIWHLLPWEWSAVPADGDGIRREFLALVMRRKRHLWWIGGVMFAGVVLVGVGLVVP